MDIPKEIKPSLTVNFLVIGGGFTGLITAYALARSGHLVTVLEKGEFDDKMYSKGCVVMPNMSKIFYRWGLEEQLQRTGVRSTLMSVARFETGEYLGKARWDQRVFSDSGGDILYAHATKIRRLAYKIATEIGVNLRQNSEVISIDVDTHSVRLASGETLSADVIVGADGVDGISRAALLSGQPEEPTHTGLVFYSAIVPEKDVKADPELMGIVDTLDFSVLLGNNRASKIIPLAFPQNISFQVYAPDIGITSEPTVEELREAVGQISNSALCKCIDSSTLITRKHVYRWPELYTWVHKTSRLLVIGDAAHQMPPGGTQNIAVDIEDAAALGRLFAYLSDKDQIRDFMFAFEDLRQARCAKMAQSEHQNLVYFSLPDSEKSRRRDAMLKENDATGEWLMHDINDSEATDWMKTLSVYSYDPEDDVDDWWLKWGALKEKAKVKLDEPPVDEMQELDMTD